MISFTSFFCIFILFYLLLSKYFPAEEAAEIRLRDMSATLEGRRNLRTHVDELSRPLVLRLLSPLTGSLAARLPRLAPKAFRKNVAEKLATACGFGGLGVDEYFLLTTVLGILIPVIVAGFLFMEQFPLNKVISFSILSSAVGFCVPYILLEHKLKTRRHSMQLELPDTLDLLTVSVEAGLGFDGALIKLSEKMKGALIDEFTRMLNEMRVGVPRRDALIALGKRCNLPDVYSFTMSLIQADQLGVSIGNVLRIKSATIREQRRQQAEELAMKAPVKMLFPLVFFIFPTIFIVLLGPAILKIVDTLGKK
jgi:tight adherence protein C